MIFLIIILWFLGICLYISLMKKIVKMAIIELIQELLKPEGGDTEEVRSFLTKLGGQIEKKAQ